METSYQLFLAVVLICISLLGLTWAAVGSIIAVTVTVAYLHLLYCYLLVKFTSGEAFVAGPLGSWFSRLIWIPYVGCAVNYGMKPQKFLSDARRLYGDVFSLYM